MPSRARRRRWPLGLAAALGFLLVGSLVAAVVQGRRLEGSVPGKAPILGLAVAPGGFLLGTSDGVLASTDGFTWEPVPAFIGESLVAGGGGVVAVASGGELSLSSDLERFTPVPAKLDRPSALTVAPDGTVWIADGSRLVAHGASGAAREISLGGGPGRALSLGVTGGEPVRILAGDLSEGLWQTSGEGGEWERILGTPLRALQVDPGEPGRYLIGTAAGVLTAARTAPEFTDLRLPVEALAEFDGTFYAITLDRLIYESADGTRWSARTPGAG